MIAQLNKSYILSRPSKMAQRLMSYLFFEGRPATTRGKWFNPVTFFMLKFASKRNISVKSESPVFITGTGRSGSTILGMILSMHKDLGFLNEPKALWHTVYPEGDLTGSYSVGEAHFNLNAEDFEPEMAQRVKSIYTSFLKYSRSKVILDKYPEMIFRVDFIKAIFASPRFIFLYRNPWDTIISTAEWSDKNRVESDGNKEDWWGINDRKWNLMLQQVVPYDPYLANYKDEVALLTSQIDKAAVEWIVTMNKGLAVVEQNPELFFPVSYEELLEDPKQMLHRIFQFLELRTDPVALKYAEKELEKRPVRMKVDIHPVLREALSETSVKLGYGAQFSEMSMAQ